MTAPRRTDDGFFRAVFSHAPMTEGLLRFVGAWLLPDLKADPATLVQLPGDFIAADMTERRSDAVWHALCPGRDFGIHLHLEFQSVCRWEMLLRMRNYQDQLCQKLMAQGGPRVNGGYAPAVFSIVIYNGVPPWAAPGTLSEMLPPPLRWLPGARADSWLVLDIRRIPQEWLEDEDNPFVLLLLERAWDAKGIADALALAARHLPDTPSGQAILRRFRVRMQRRLAAFPHTPEIAAILSLKEDDPMFEEQTVDLVGNLIRRVQAESEAKGEAKSRLDFVHNLLRMGSSADFISEATGLPPAEVERLAAGMR